MNDCITLLFIKKFTQLTDDELTKAISEAPYNYKTYEIPKKKVKKGPDQKRIVCQPSLRTKILQYALIPLLKTYNVCTDVAMAYIDNVSNPLLKNASYHRYNDYLLHLDFKDFFPSITPDMLFKELDKQKPNELSSEDKNIITRVCFKINKQSNRFSLAIGAPASPLISNIVMYSFDNQIHEFAKEHHCVYTRYADDIFVSSKFESNIHKCEEQIKESLKERFYMFIYINQEKTRKYGPKQDKKITGLKIINHEIQVPRHLKRYVRSIIYKGNLTQEERMQLQGYLSFICQHDPKYYKKLLINEGVKISELTQKSSIIQSNSTKEET